MIGDIFPKLTSKKRKGKSILIPKPNLKNIFKKVRDFDDKVNNHELPNGIIRYTRITPDLYGNLGLVGFPLKDPTFKGSIVVTEEDADKTKDKKINFQKYRQLSEEQILKKMKTEKKETNFRTPSKISKSFIHKIDNCIPLFYCLGSPKSVDMEGLGKYFEENILEKLDTKLVGDRVYDAPNLEKKSPMNNLDLPLIRFFNIHNPTRLWIETKDALKIPEYRDNKENEYLYHPFFNYIRNYNDLVFAWRDLENDLNKNNHILQKELEEKYNRNSNIGLVQGIAGLTNQDFNTFERNIDDNLKINDTNKMLKDKINREKTGQVLREIRANTQSLHNLNIHNAFRNNQGNNNN